jgi:uncharacterized protein
MTTSVQCTAFLDFELVASGSVADVLPALKAASRRIPHGVALVFDNETSRQVELDLRDGLPGSAVVSPPAEPPRAPGRPKLGVVAREVTLLPRHWDWLNRQPGGASVALRKLIENARRVHEGRDEVRRSQEVAYRFMSTIAGNLPGFEEATRALFARDQTRFEEQLKSWPADVRAHALTLAEATFVVDPLPDADQRGVPKERRAY